MKTVKLSYSDIIDIKALIYFEIKRKESNPDYADEVRSLRELFDRLDP